MTIAVATNFLCISISSKFMKDLSASPPGNHTLVGEDGEEVLEHHDHGDTAQATHTFLRVFLDRVESLGDDPPWGL